jgi:hypothetical protein
MRPRERRPHLGKMPLSGITTPGITLKNATGIPISSSLVEMFLIKDVALLGACLARCVPRSAVRLSAAALRHLQRAYTAPAPPPSGREAAFLIT